MDSDGLKNCRWFKIELLYFTYSFYNDYVVVKLTGSYIAR